MIGEFLNMRSEGGTEPVFGGVGVGFEYGNKCLFQGVPEILVKPGSGRVAA